MLTLALDKYGEEFRLYLAGKQKFYEFMQIMGRQGLQKPFPLNHASKEQLTDLIEQAQDIATTAKGLMASERILTGYELRTLQDILTQVATHDLESFAAVMTADINSQIDLYSAKDTVYKFYKNNYQWIKNEQNVLDMPVTMEWKPGGPDGKGGYRSILKPGQGKGPDPGGASTGPDTGGYMSQAELQRLMQADVDMKNAEVAAGIATGRGGNLRAYQNKKPTNTLPGMETTVGQTNIIDSATLDSQQRSNFSAAPLSAWAQRHMGPVGNFIYGEEQSSSAAAPTGVAGALTLTHPDLTTSTSNSDDSGFNQTPGVRNVGKKEDMSEADQKIVNLKATRPAPTRHIVSQETRVTQFTTPWMLNDFASIATPDTNLARDRVQGMPPGGMSEAERAKAVRVYSAIIGKLGESRPAEETIVIVDDIDFDAGPKGKRTDDQPKLDELTEVARASGKFNSTGKAVGSAAASKGQQAESNIIKGNETYMTRVMNKGGKVMKSLALAEKWIADHPDDPIYIQQVKKELQSAWKRFNQKSKTPTGLLPCRPVGGKAGLLTAAVGYIWRNADGGVQKEYKIGETYPMSKGVNVFQTLVGVFTHDNPKPDVTVPPEYANFIRQSPEFIAYSEQVNRAIKKFDLLVNKVYGKAFPYFYAGREDEPIHVHSINDMPLR